MSDADKMRAFGSWLASKKIVLLGELQALAINGNASIDSIRIKSGHIEAYAHALEAFTELYRGSLTKFRKERLGEDIEEEE